MAAELEIKALVDINSGIRALQEFGKASVKSLNTIESAFADLNKQVQTIFKLNTAIGDIAKNTGQAAAKLNAISDSLKNVEANTGALNGIQAQMTGVAQASLQSANSLKTVNGQLGQIKESVSGIKNVEEQLGQTNKNVSTMTKALGGLNAGFKALAAAAAAAIAFIAAKFTLNALLGVIEKSIRAAAEYETALTDLNVALALSGNYSAKASKGLEDFAQGIQETTKFSDDAVLSGFALLEQLTALDEQGLRTAGQAAIDMAAALRIDLQTAFQLVGKAANGEIGTFARYGIEIRKGKTDTETFQNALRALAAFQGTAAAQVNTFDGAIIRLRNGIGDLYKNLGFTLTQNPAIIEGIKGLTDIFKKLTGFVEDNRGSITRLVKEGFITLIKAIPSLFTLIDFAADGFAFLQFTVNGALVAVNKFAKYAKLIQTDFTLTLSKGSRTREKNKISELYDEEAKSLEESRKRILENGSERKVLLSQMQALAEKGVNETVKALNADNKLTDGTIKNGQKRQKSNEEEVEKAKKLYEKQIADKKAFVEKLGSSPTLILFEKLPALMTKTEAGAASALGVLNAALNGAQGAVKLVSGTLGMIADSILPGIGGTVAAIVEQLAKGPEAARKFVQDFLDALPEIIRNIGPAAREAIVTIIEGLPELLTQLMEDMPAMFIEQMLTGPEKIIQATIRAIPKLIQAFIKAIPSIIRGFIDEFSKNMPAFVGEAGRALAQAVKDAVAGAVANLNPFGGNFLGGGGIGGFIGGIGDFFGFAEGGLVPPGFPGDSFPARLSSKEFVVPADLTDGLAAMIKRDSEGTKDAEIVALLRGILYKDSAVTVNVGNREIVNVMRDSLLSGRVLA